MSAPALRPLSTGEILDGGFALYRRQFVPFVVSSLVFLAPVTALRIAKPEIGVFASLFALVAMKAASIFIAAEATLGAAVGTAVRKFGPLLFNMIIFWALVFIGCLLLIVPGIIVGLMSFAYAQVVVIEGRGWGFARSATLAKGAWGKISALWLMASLINMLPSMALTGGVVGFMAVSSNPEELLRGTRVPAWLEILTAFISCFTVPFPEAVLTLLYFDQRVRKEGFGIEMQAAALAAGTPPPSPAG